MADEYEGAAKLRQAAFEPFDAGQIEMVGRLVEEQHVRLSGEHAGECRLAPLAAGKGGGRGGGIEPEIAQHGLGLMGGRAFRRRIIEHGLRAREIRHLP